MARASALFLLAVAFVVVTGQPGCRDFDSVIIEPDFDGAVVYGWTMLASEVMSECKGRVDAEISMFFDGNRFVLGGQSFAEFLYPRHSHTLSFEINLDFLGPGNHTVDLEVRDMEGNLMSGDSTDRRLIVIPQPARTFLYMIYAHAAFDITPFLGDDASVLLLLLMSHNQTIVDEIGNRATVLFRPDVATASAPGFLIGHGPTLGDYAYFILVDGARSLSLVADSAAETTMTSTMATQQQAIVELEAFLNLWNPAVGHPVLSNHPSCDIIDAKEAQAGCKFSPYFAAIHRDAIRFMSNPYGLVDQDGNHDSESIDGKDTQRLQFVGADIIPYVATRLWGRNVVQCNTVRASRLPGDDLIVEHPAIRKWAAPALNLPETVLSDWTHVIGVDGHEAALKPDDPALNYTLCSCCVELESLDICHPLWEGRRDAPSEGACDPLDYDVDFHFQKQVALRGSHLSARMDYLESQLEQLRARVTANTHRVTTTMS